MHPDFSAFLPLQTVRIGKTGKRTFDQEGKRLLIQACMQPGVSISGMALKAGVNANLLGKWISKYQQLSSPVFVPVVTAGLNTSALAEAPHLVSQPTPTPPEPIRISAQLPNGTILKLECSGQDINQLRVMISALGGS